MDALISILAIVLGIIGIIGSIVPGIPGPPLGWIGLLLVYIKGGVLLGRGPVSLTMLLVFLGVATLVTLMDYFLPAKMTKLTGGSSHASRGALAGLVLGIIFTPVGMLLGCFLGAFLAELYWGEKSGPEALKASFGAFLGVVTGTGVKLIATCLMMWFIVLHA